MTTVLGIVAILSLHPRLTISLWWQRRRRERNPGLNTVSEARNYAQVLHVAVPGETTAMLHHTKELTVPRLRTTPLVIEMVRTETAPWDYSTPIYDSLMEDWPALLRAMRTPTQEFEVLVAPLTSGWCDSCRSGRDGERRHQSCPGCGCPCLATEALIGRPSDVVGVA